MTQTSYGLLKGKKGIIFGPLNEQSLGWKIALACHREGAKLAISNIATALKMGNTAELARICGQAPLLVADATSDDELKALFAELKTTLGEIDFIVHSVGMSANIRKKIPYESTNYIFYNKGLEISAISLHKIIRYALEAGVLKDNGSIVALSYIGAQRVFSQYNDMNDAKALLEAIARNFGSRLADRGIRVNTVSQSPTRTSAGSGISNFDAMYEYANLLAPLGNASGEECADYVVTLLSDLSRKVTMQNLYHDGGFSSAGISEKLLGLLERSQPEAGV
ncbi:MAG: enoyl-ACP reductase [Dehalococcoides mccartyi]|uniref:enoyl-ACP reductase FabI n=1 Tax=Dehalococcoides TaxID=61434 RepID=UPI001A0B798E|nr:enoyl-ACP reductase [Dehalococcoides mccartyi]MBF4482031.1 enoyl-ACP reductase [Dehalococcoides mccartyi]MBJ7531387.1 enoyl-ACP reductase [Dehalococcoides mccartyi]MDP4279104.1 enoyl-ACP reductase [Dehalococcoides mccartyi]